MVSVATQMNRASYSQKPKEFRPERRRQSSAEITCASGHAIARDVLERLEELDDMIYQALTGDPNALDAAQVAWRRAQEEVQPCLLEESRRQYVRRARDVWQSYRHQPADSPTAAFAALEVLMSLEMADCPEPSRCPRHK